MSEKLGIDLIKDLIKDGVKLAKEYEKANEDGKITKFEMIGFGDNVIALTKDLFSVKKIIAEAKDADSAERQELIDYVISLEVLGSSAEIILVNSFEYIEGQILLWEANIVPIINVFKK